jgi:lysophospholipase L1-like esterase
LTFAGGSAVLARRVLLSVSLAVVAVVAAVGVVPGVAASADTTHYYVALGDSLSRGYMPGLGDTDHGYADDLYATLHAADPTLALVKLGCSGETTGTMINGGECTDRYPVGTSQLAAAEQYLRDHAGQVTYLTLDIGANDVDNCASGGSIDPVCVAQGVLTIAQNLNTILTGLQAAAGKVPVKVGMNYYDPFLASWLTGTQGKAVALASVTLLEVLNATEGTLYGLHGFKIADVASAYHSLDFVSQRNVPPYGQLPTDVAYICQYTFMCSQQNIHPTTAGYQLIANAFVKRIA